MSDNSEGYTPTEPVGPVSQSPTSRLDSATPTPPTPIASPYSDISDVCDVVLKRFMAIQSSQYPGPPNIQMTEDEVSKSRLPEANMSDSTGSTTHSGGIGLIGVSVDVSLRSLTAATQRTEVEYGGYQDASDLCDTILDRFMKISTEQYDAPPNISMTEGEITQILVAAREAFLAEPMLIECSPPINICGDTHGQFGDLLRMFDYAGWPPNTRYLFLGDYVDRGRQSIEVMVFLLAIKLRYPRSMYLLRGNHECQSINRVYGFFEEVKRRYSIKLYKTFQDTFNTMPIAGLVGGRIFCMHGGLSPNLDNFEQLRQLKRPTDIPDHGPLCDLLWADPDESAHGTFEPNRRGVSYSFSPAAVSTFCDKLDIDLIARAHQVVEDGYEFFANQKLVTIFSAPNYCGQFDNAAACMQVDADLTCSFKILRPFERKKKP